MKKTSSPSMVGRGQVVTAVAAVIGDQRPAGSRPRYRAPRDSALRPSPPRLPLRRPAPPRRDDEVSDAPALPAPNLTSPCAPLPLPPILTLRLMTDDPCPGSCRSSFAALRSVRAFPRGTPPCAISIFSTNMSSIGPTCKLRLRRLVARFMPDRTMHIITDSLR